MGKLLINDSADAVVRRKSDGHLFVTAEAQLSSLSGSLGLDEFIMGGIGNKKLSKIRGDKTVTSTLRNAFFDMEMMSMTQGIAIEDAGNATVYRKEDGLTVVPNTTDSTLEVTVTGTPVNNTVQIRNAAGELEEAVSATGVVTVPEGHAVEGDIVSAFYQEDVTGEVLSMKSDKFSEAHTVEYHTIAYDPDTSVVVSDIYIQLDHVLPSGEFELSFENGTAIAPEVTFDALTVPNTNDIGRIVVVPRTVTP